jgi:hypothetical protein
MHNHSWIAEEEEGVNIMPLGVRRMIKDDRSGNNMETNGTLASTLVSSAIAMRTLRGCPVRSRGIIQLLVGRAGDPVDHGHNITY